MNCVSLVASIVTEPVRVNPEDIRMTVVYQPPQSAVKGRVEYFDVVAPEWLYATSARQFVVGAQVVITGRLRQSTSDGAVEIAALGMTVRKTPNFLRNKDNQ